VQFPITVGLHRSRFLAAGIVIGYLLATIAVVVTAWDPAAGAGLLGLVGVGAALSWRHHDAKVAALRLFGDGRIEYRLSDGREFVTAQLLPPATVHPWLTVFRLKRDTATFNVVVAPDSVATEDFRRLRVWLRWRAEFRAVPDDV